MLSGKYAEFNATLSDAAKELLTTEFLRDRVGGELKGFGTLGAIGQPVFVQEGKNSNLTFPVRFSETSVNIVITLNDSLQVSAFHLHPGNAPLPPGRQQPAYSKPDLFQFPRRDHRR